MGNPRRKLPISLFLQNFRVLDEKLQERKHCAQLGIEEITNNPLPDTAAVNKLNCLIAERRAVQMVYDLVEELKEELEEGLEPLAQAQ